MWLAFLTVVQKKPMKVKSQVDLWLPLDRAAGAAFMNVSGTAEPSEHCLPVPRDAAAQHQLRTPGDPPLQYSNALSISHV